MTDKSKKIWKGVGITALVLGAIWVIGRLITNKWNPFAWFASKTPADGTDCKTADNSAGHYENGNCIKNTALPDNNNSVNRTVGGSTDICQDLLNKAGDAKSKLILSWQNMSGLYLTLNNYPFKPHVSMGQYEDPNKCDTLLPMLRPVCKQQVTKYNTAVSDYLKDLKVYDDAVALYINTCQPTGGTGGKQIADLENGIVRPYAGSTAKGTTGGNNAPAMVTVPVNTPVPYSNGVCTYGKPVTRVQVAGQWMMQLTKVSCP